MKEIKVTITEDVMIAAGKHMLALSQMGQRPQDPLSALGAAVWAAAAKSTDRVITKETIMVITADSSHFTDPFS